MTHTKINDEQDITSYLIQELYFSQKRSIKVVREVLGTRDKSISSFHQGELKRISFIKSLNLPDAITILENHTRYRYYRLPMDSTQQSSLREHHFGKAVQWGAKKVGISDLVTATHGICMDCVSSDLMTMRFPITRRIFLVPGIVVCPAHKKPLRSFCKEAVCVSKRGVDPEFLVPSLKCPCGNELEEIVHLDERGHAAAVWIAEICQQILQGLHVDVLTPQNVHTAVRSSAIFNRHLNGPTPLVQIMHTFEQAIGPILGQHLLLTESTKMYLIKKGRRLVRSTVQLIATIYAVFGDMQQFKDALTLGSSHIRFKFDFVSNTRGMSQKNDKQRKSWSKTIPPNSVFIAQIESLTAEQQEELRTESRRWLNNLKQKKTGLTISSFRNGTGRSRWHRFLTLFDKEWLHQQFPMCPPPRERIRLTTEEIGLMKAMAEKIANEKSNNHPLKRITRSHIRGVIPRSRFTSAMNMDADFRRTVMRLVDTDNKWRKRFTRIICQRASRIDPNSHWGKQNTYGGHEFREFKLLSKAAAAWLRKMESRITS